MELNRTLNNPGYLGAESSIGSNNHYMNNRTAYEENILDNEYNRLSRDEYNRLNRGSSEYSFVPSRPVSVHSYAGINYNNEFENPNPDMNKSFKPLKLVLPPGWFESLDPETGKIYYSNEATRTTQWLHPGIPKGTIMPNGIPHGWDNAFDRKTGKRYWINHIEGYNTWEKPDFTE